jgi:hypothetical protein
MHDLSNWLYGGPQVGTSGLPLTSFRLSVIVKGYLGSIHIVYKLFATARALPRHLEALLRLILA